MLPHPLINFEKKDIIQWNLDLILEIIYQKIKDGAFITNLDECKSTGTLLPGLCVKGDDVTYFDSFEVEHIPPLPKNE